MKVKVLQNVFIVAVAVFIITTLVTLFIEYRYVSSEQEKEFREQAEYLSGLIETSGTDVLKTAQSTADIRLRVTVIKPDGSVDYDSQEVAASLENHADREEVKDAFANGRGESKRYSDTLKRTTFNYAVIYAGAVGSPSHLPDDGHARAGAHLLRSDRSPDRTQGDGAHRCHRSRQPRDA